MKNNARAAAHRAKKAATAANDPDTVDHGEEESQEQVHNIAASVVIPPTPPHVQAQAVPAVPPQHSSEDAVPAPANLPITQPGTDQGLLQETAAAASEVQDELVHEQSEVKVIGVGVFENCPDENLSEEYFGSLKKFILSESHLQENIANIKILQLSSRQLGEQLFDDSVNVEISVKIASL